MSVEFLDPEPAPASADPGQPSPGGTVDAIHARPRPYGSWWGRAVGLAALLAAVLTYAGVRTTLYHLTRTAVVVDFGGTTTIDTVFDVDAFGASPPTPVAPLAGEADGGIARTVTLPDGTDYGTMWVAVAVALAVLGVWALVSPRSRRPAALLVAAAALGGGVALAVRLTLPSIAAGFSVSQIPYAAAPAGGFWLVVAGAGLALLAGLARLVLGRSVAVRSG